MTFDPQNMGTSYSKDYLLNHNGFKASFTQNGKYLFAQFTASKSGHNYIGVTRFDLTTKKPTATVVWAKEQQVDSNSTYDYYLRGFMALEYGDVIVDYLPGYNPGYSNSSHPTFVQATRQYVSVDPSITLAANQKSFVLTAGDNSSGWPLSGKLWDYLAANQTPTTGIPQGTYASASNYSLSSPVYLYSQTSTLVDPLKFYINSDPNSSSKVLYLKLSANKNGYSNGLCDYAKVTIGSDVSVTPIQSVQSLGQTPSCDAPSAILGSKLYSWSKSPYQVSVSGTPFPIDLSGIVSHPLAGSASTFSAREYTPSGSISGTYAQTLLATNDSLFVLDGFNGYFGGCSPGQNAIFQTKVTGNNASSKALDIGAISSGLYVLTNASANPKTDELQLSGAQKGSGCSTTYTLWSAYVDSKGISSAQSFPKISVSFDSNAPAPAKPIVSLKNSDGTTPTYAAY